MLIFVIALFCVFLVMVFIKPLFKAWKYKDFNSELWNFRN